MAGLANTARTAACDAICGLVDAGAAAGHFRLGTSGMGSILATITLNDPAFTLPSTNGVASLDVTPVPSATASATGTAAQWDIRDSNNNTVISGTIGTGSEDLDIDNTSVTSGQTVNITSLTVTVPASPP